MNGVPRVARHKFPTKKNRIGSLRDAPRTRLALPNEPKLALLKYSAKPVLLLIPTENGERSSRQICVRRKKKNRDQKQASQA
jgi:hypothetical protein